MSNEAQEAAKKASKRQDVQKLIRALRRIERSWPKGVWIYATGSASLHLMAAAPDGKFTEDGGGMDQDAEVHTFQIPNDGGDW